MPSSPGKRVTPLDSALARAISNRRRELGITQQRMAELIGVTYQQVHKYESEINRVPLSSFFRIAAALAIDLKPLITLIKENIDTPEEINSGETSTNNTLTRIARKLRQATPAQRDQAERFLNATLAETKP